MLDLLTDRTYRHLFLAQVVALIGTGLATVALGLLAYDLRGDGAALVLGTIFTIKMVAYVLVAPVAAALLSRLPRRAVLVVLDAARAVVALCLPFVTEVWQVYVLIFVLQSASAAFTPAYQAVLPDILPDEARYTRALSLSRLAYDLESLASPMLAALLLLLVPFEALFAGTVLGFAASAALVLSVRLPRPPEQPGHSIRERATRGLRIYLATPRLRGLLAFNMALAACGAMVLVNTVLIVRRDLGLGDAHVALAMAAFGAGSIVAALSLPRLLDRLGDRAVMTAGSLAMALGLLGLVGWTQAAGAQFPALLGAWAVIGFGFGAVSTPGGRLLRRSSGAQDRAAVFAAQFALSHACWLLCYPLAGWLMTVGGAQVAGGVLAALSVLALGGARRLWPAQDPDGVLHSHPDLPPDHPHLRGHRAHSHAYVIDDLHPHWPAGPSDQSFFPKPSKKE